ncbi:MAG: DUF5054 domain-containing protein, partial [Acidobacteriota bacterium]
PGMEDALAFGHSSDNLGPQTLEQVTGIFHHLQAAHPRAEVFASTLNAFAEKLAPIRSTLPVVTQEIGDTWIHGIGSDPLKVSQFRELLRLRDEWLASSPDLRHEAHFDAFQRRLLLVPEHTWGMDEKTFLGDHESYSPVDFSAARGRENFRTLEASWAEKRSDITAAVEALGDTPFATEAQARLAALQPRRPDLTGRKALPAGDLTIALPHFSAHFDPQSGALTLLTDRHGEEWASPTHPLALLRYQTFSAADYERFFHQYILAAEQDNGWSREDFTKPGLETANPISRFWQPRVVEHWATEQDILFHLAGEPRAVREYGCPQEFFLQYFFNLQSTVIEINLQWFHKPACRLPEALWLSFRPRVDAAAEWRLDKLGASISPLEVVENGNRHLHACGHGVTVRERSRQLAILTLDSPLVAPGEPSLLDFTNAQPDLRQGVHFNLHNNLWGTNFPMWFEEDCLFRFRLELSRHHP